MILILLNTLLGLILGSFITMAAYRIPLNMSLGGRSRCPACHNVIKFQDLVPIISFINLIGKCRNCKTPIPSRYLAIEITAALMFCLNALIISDNLEKLLLVNLIIIIILIIIVIDFETMIINDSLLLILSILGVIFAYVSGNELLNIVCLPIINLLVAMCISGFCKFLFKKDALGSGDLKLFFVAGLFLVIENLTFFYVMTGFIGILIGIYWQERRIGIYYPFGPAICISLYFCILFGKNLDLTLLTIF